jgi:dynein heavy chain
MQPRITIVGSKSPQVIIAEMVTNMIKNKEIPDMLNVVKENCNKELFIEDEKGLLPSLSIVLLQESSRFNRLLKTIKSSLENLKNAIDGTALMSDELDSMFYSLLNNAVPKNWQKVAYPSLKPLASWITDLRERVAFMADWLKNGQPNSYWMSGLFFPQGFLTAVLQSHARQPGKEIPIDELSFSFKFMDFDKENCSARPPEGVYINGLILEGASFDRKRKLLIDSLKVIS